MEETPAHAALAPWQVRFARQRLSLGRASFGSVLWCCGAGAAEAGHCDRLTAEAPYWLNAFECHVGEPPPADQRSRARDERPSAALLAAWLGTARVE
jgi:hypothetical protein